MQSLVAEIWLFLLAAFAIGGASFWMVGRVRTRSASERLNQTWQTRLSASDDSWSSKLRSAEQNFSSQLDQQTAQISVITTDLESERGRRVALGDELAKWKADVAALLEDQDLMGAKLRRMDDRLAVALEDADKSDLEVKRLTAEIAEIEHESESYRLRAHLLEPLDDQVKELEAALGDKNRKIDDLKALEVELRERDAKIERLESDHRAALERRVQEATQLRARIGELEPLAERLQAGLTSAKQAKERLEAEVARLRARRSGPNGEAAKSDDAPPRSDRPVGTAAREVGMQDVQAGRSGGEFGKSDGRDDLKRIAGVGPVLEHTLNGMGVVTYRQIASWNEAEIERVGNRLEGFHDRIRRDDWVGQARRLHREAYGESV